MRNIDRAKQALARAERESDEISRSLWLAKAGDHAVSAHAVLVGGAAVNLHTGSYRPTDVDMCAHLDDDDRQALIAVGFEHLQGDHFAVTFGDGERWLLEFPDSQVDGDVMHVNLDQDETLEVISLESLIVDRLLRATDGTQVMLDEAVRLCYSVFENADWSRVEAVVRDRGQLEPLLRLEETYVQVMNTTRSLRA